MRMQEFFSFDELTTKHNPREVGHRALILGDLYNAGFPVQDGFVIGSQMLKEFVVESGIQEKLFRFLKSGKREKVVDILLQKNVPEVEQKIIEQCTIHGMKDVFLQHSGVFQDHKFVVGGCRKNTIMSGVKQCWASMFTSKLLDKLNRKNLFSAVIVQHNLGIRKSGWLYTEHPLEEGKTFVEMIKPKKYSLTFDHVEKKTDLDCPLTLHEKDSLLKLGKNIQHHYGASAKVKWAISNRLYVTGCRPINEHDKDYFTNQLTSSVLRSNSSVN